TAVTLVWDVTNVSRLARLGALAPLVIVAAWVFRSAWDRFAGSRRARLALAAGAAAIVALAVGSSFVIRPGGWDADLSWAVVGETRRHLTEAIGLLGWLDTPLPRWSV